MTFRACIRILLVSAPVLAALPVLAGNIDAGSLEARVDRLLWQLVNDERYSHLQIAANYEGLRAQLLEQACFVADTPCAPFDRIHHGRAMTSEISPEQAEVLEQLMFTLHKASASVVVQPAHLMVSTTE
jgi:hypothetical protein